MKNVNFKKFKIQSRVSNLWFWVYVYDTVQELRDESDRYDKLRKNESDNSEVLGLVHSYERFRVLESGETKRIENIGIVRLAKTYLSTEIVAHEIAHAAMHNYRKHFNSNAKFGDGTSPRIHKKEEDFCHLYGQLFRNITRKLYKHKLWN